MLVKIISIMLENTYTTDDLVLRIGSMRKYYEQRLFQPGKEVTVRSAIENECDNHTLQAVEHWNERFEKEKVQPLVVYEALESVQEDLAGIPSIKLYVPVRFTPSQVEQLGVWVRTNIQPNILISLHIDPRVTGGCSFIWKDVYHDFSLRYFIDKKKKEIHDMFGKYAYAK